MEGEPADLVTEALDAMGEPQSGRGERVALSGQVRRGDVNRIFKHVRRVWRDPMLDLQAQQDEAFLAASEEIVKSASLGKWGKDRFVATIDNLAQDYGLEGYGRHAKTWYRTVVLNASYNRGLLLALHGTPASRLYPFLVLRTVGDELVTDEHALLDGFVAASGWPGWKAYIPPLGWNCRCRLVFVSYSVAEALGWLGKEFPRGRGFLQPKKVKGRLVIPGRTPGFLPPLEIVDKALPF